MKITKKRYILINLFIFEAFIVFVGVTASVPTMISTMLGVMIGATVGACFERFPRQ